MQLNTLLKLLKHGFHVDEELRAYIYKDRVEIVEHEPEITIVGERVISEFNGLLCIIYYNDKNIITAIEPSSLSLLTTANKALYKTLIDFIGQDIADLKNYPILEDRYKSEIYQSV